MPLYAGVCETNITPPLGVWMCGYAFRPSGCVAVHDELFARALVLNNGHTSLAILAMDLIGLDFGQVEAVRHGISAGTGILPCAIMLNASHTHGGPNVGRLNTMGASDPAYIDILVRKLVGITRQAADNLRPASLAYGRAPVQLGLNRRQYPRDAGGLTSIGRNYAGPVAPNVDALAVRSSRGEPFALLFAHACHPTTLGGDNLQITADFPGVACQTLSAAARGAVMPFFLQGCCGNINPEPRGTFEHVTQHGEMLAEAALAAMECAELLDYEELGFDEVNVNLPLVPPPSLGECETKVREWEEKAAQERAGGNDGRILHAEGLRDYFRMARDIAADPAGRLSRPFAIQRLSVAGAQFVGMPAEMFVQYQLDLESQAVGPMFALGYTNGVHGYVPTAADYPYGGYEVDGANRYYGTLMYTPECEPLIRDAAYDLLGLRDPDRSPFGV